MTRRWKEQAFSIVDLMMVIAISGTLCSFAVTALSSARVAVINSRLQSDVDTINRAIDVFQAKGGSLEGLTDPNAILTKLKEKEEISSGDLVHFLGSADEMIDHRLTARFLSVEESKSGQARAVWNADENCFVVTHEGDGVREFFIH